jgi:chorismate mutase
MEIIPLEQWIPSKPAPLVISGPCSAESEQQVMATATALAAIPQVRIFRAGIWKPRTRPEFFEGVGEKGLGWLQAAGRKTGLLTSVEVATPSHIEAALRYGIPVLWIGARTVTNPFSMQEIAEALKGTGVPVMVKNPVAPDLPAWIGAFERLAGAGISKMVAIHRGFHYFNRTPYRNSPMWEIPLELKRIFPCLPMVCDPSHICGSKSLIEEVSGKALDLGMDGLMIESHIDPQNALTDAAQQITPAELTEMIGRMVKRDLPATEETDLALESLREVIDKLDKEILHVLADRMAVVREIAEEKQQKNLSILQSSRWSDLIYDRISLGEQLGLNRSFLFKLLDLIHKESIDIQEENYKKGK